METAEPPETSGTEGWMQKVKSAWKEWKRSIWTGVITFLLTIVIMVPPAYSIAYDAGARAARTARTEELKCFREKLKKLLDEEEKRFRESLTTNRKAFEDYFVEKKMALDSSLINNLVTIAVAGHKGEQDKQPILRHATGNGSGDKKGSALGQNNCCCESACNMAALKFSGGLWSDFTRAVYSHTQKKKTETGIRSSAEAIVEIARIGRNAAGGLACSFDGLVDDIQAAEKAGKLEKVNELITALQDSLPAKSKAYQEHLRILLTPQESP